MKVDKISIIFFVGEFSKMQYEYFIPNIYLSPPQFPVLCISFCKVFFSSCLFFNHPCYLGFLSPCKRRIQDKNHENLTRLVTNELLKRNKINLRDYFSVRDKVMQTLICRGKDSKFGKQRQCSIRSEIQCCAQK